MVGWTDAALGVLCCGTMDVRSRRLSHSVLCVTHVTRPRSEHCLSDTRRHSSPMTHQRSLWSGCLGATASCLGKLALDADSMVVGQAKSLCRNNFDWYAMDDILFHEILGGIQADVSGCDIVGWMLRGALLLLMLLCNAWMLHHFLKGMEQSGSVAGTALSSAANFTVSAIYGYFIWREDIWNPKWGMGFLLVVVGMACLAQVTAQEPNMPVAAKQDKND